jgi:anti-anti-sigma factor
MSGLPTPGVESVLEDGVLVLTILCRQIEGHEIANQLRQELLEAVKQANATRVIVDMQHTRYLSSVAFWPLLALRKHLHEVGGKLLICGLSGSVGDVFYTTKMVDSTGASNAPFEMAESCQIAVARLRDEQTSAEE